MELVFVCTGNTCRSSMAEALARQIWQSLWADAGSLTVASAGVAAWPGEPASPKAVQALSGKGIDLSTHRARLLTAELLCRAGLILTMTQSQRDYILTKFPQAAGKVYTLAEFAGETEDVPDPFGASQQVYDRCGAVLESLVARALERIAGSNSEPS